MCGIFAYLGKKEAAAICLEGLKKLEYRGYDSSGIGGIIKGAIIVCKEVGNISALEKKLQNQKLEFSTALSHTRWATHGKPSQENAHPQIDQHKTVAVVHNGVIENYAILRDKLIEEKRVVFSSETDTETIAQLIASHYHGDFLRAALDTFSSLEGSFAVAVIHKDHPDEMIVTAEKSPLVIGYDNVSQEIFVASDPMALAGKKLTLFFLVDGEIALLKQGMQPVFFDRKGNKITKKSTVLNLNENLISKGSYEHFMLKEICEQGETIRNAMLKHFDEKQKTAVFQDLSFDPKELASIKHIIIIACGTSWHAGFIAAYFFEEVAKISTRVEIASEYRYKTPIIFPDTLIIALSQSGETADTVAAVRNVKNKGARIIALCNVPGSTLTREVDSTLFLHAGPEVAVASTKTFTSQVAVLYLLTLLLARQRSMTKDEGRVFFKRLYELPVQADEILHNHMEIQTLAKKYARFNDFYFLGRGILYPTALEAALKLKEIAYINAVGYPSGEMKHGPIALLTKNVPVVIFCANEQLQQKVMSNLMESKARGSPIIVFGWKEFHKEFGPVADDVVFVPKTSDELAPILLTVATQLFAYYVAKERGAEIDQPRNLAKSVTVE